MLQKDRKPLSSKLDAINRTETLCKNVINTVNDNDKIPTRKRSLVGNRMVDHALHAYEFARYANLIEVKDLETAQLRLGYERSAEKEMFDLCTNLRLLPCAVNETPTCKWIVHLQEEAHSCFILLSKWRASDELRFNKYKKVNPFLYCSS